MFYSFFYFLFLYLQRHFKIAEPGYSAAILARDFITTMYRRREPYITFDQYTRSPKRLIETDSMYMALAAIGNMLYHLPPPDEEIVAPTNYRRQRAVVGPPVEIAEH